MTADNRPLAVRATDVPAPSARTLYPEPFASMVEGRMRRKLGDHFGLQAFGVNLVRMAPGAISSVRHHHSKEDEFIYVLEGTLTLTSDDTEVELGPGMCAGFRAGNNVAHSLSNRTHADALFIEIGARFDDDECVYPYDDLMLTRRGNEWVYTHKDGTPY
jgi:uncharacterized cupin superfamily protein